MKVESVKPSKPPADAGSLHKKMMQLLSSLWVTHAIGSFARLGLADAMEAGADSADAIATPRGLIVGPRYTNTEMAIFRSFPTFREQTVTFRAEAFNLLNHTEFADPIQSTSSSAFGQIQTANDPRIMQFALKYTF